MHVNFNRDLTTRNSSTNIKLNLPMFSNYVCKLFSVCCVCDNQ